MTTNNNINGRLADCFRGTTTDEVIKSAEKKHFDILSVFRDEVNSDGDHDNFNFIRAYKEATEEERSVLDALLVAACGWSFSSLVELAETRNCVEEGC